MNPFPHNKHRNHLIDDAMTLLKSRDVESATREFEEIYLRGEEQDPHLVLGYARILLEADNSGRAEELLLRHNHLFSKYRDALKATQLMEMISSPKSAVNEDRKLKIAILSDSNVDYLSPILRYFLKTLKIFPRIYQSTFGNIEGEVLSDSSGLYEFSPDIVLIILSGRDIPIGSRITDGDDFIQDKLNRWRNLWNNLSRRSFCHIIQSNYVANPFSPSPNAGGATPDGCLTTIRRLNSALTEDLPSQVVILDLDELASEYGRTAWWDDTYYYNAKIPFSLNAIPLVSKHITGIVRALLGLSSKCVVLDLDNTLWGGVLGEVGLNEIELGPTPTGEPYQAFQHFLKALKNTGVLLAVASKNDWVVVKEVFARHEYMVLRLEDIAAWRVNWKPKSLNIKEIAAELNLGLDNFVFLDDNPVEREEVRNALPEVSVPVLPPEPSNYVSALVELRLFEKIRMSKEDNQRTALYHQRRKVEQLRDSVRTYDEFLAGLGMNSRVEYCNASNLNRIHQLINKTNQFNLTTKRMTRAELEHDAEDKDVICLGFHLEDIFGKHGLVGILIARVKNDSMVIENLLMSCRVIGRTLDKAMVAHLATEAISRGCGSLIGRFTLTRKNDLVKNFYEDLGFEVTGDEEGEKSYVLTLPRTEDFPEHYIQIIKPEINSIKV